jgi:chemotaxis protein methyltransferase WspC
MNLAPVLALLQERTGLDPGSLGAPTVEAAVLRRLRETRLDAPRYAARLAADAVEFGELVGEVVVPETWFFRGGDVFWHLAEHARALLSARPGPFRALSLPCSTGEEPYSLAIALAEAGVPPARVALDGVDLSARHVEAARRGRFSELAFRQTSDDLRQRYFRQSAAGWEIDPSLRALARFQTGNLLDPGLLRWEKPYDLVFCRNLFIYLTPAARKAGLDTLARLVAPGGLLCTGHAEPLDGAEKRFERAGAERYFLYRRRSEPGALATVRAEPVANAPGSDRHNPLHRARQEADRGRYDEALALCLDAETRFGPSADLYTLLGVLHHARRDDAEAGRCFARALNLDPEHREALTHLMLLSQLQGDHPRAAALRGRLERLPPGGPS